MNTKAIISTYDAIAIDYDKKYWQPSLRIFDFLQYMKPESLILDTGCGAGNNSVFLSNFGHNIIGIDLSDNMLSIAKTKQSDAVFKKMDMCELDFPRNYFDGVIASYSVCHLPKNKVLKFLQSVYDVSKTKAYFFIETYIGKSEEITITEPLNSELTIDFNIMSEQEINRLLKSAGFKILEIYSIESEFTGCKDVCIIAQK